MNANTDFFPFVVETVSVVTTKLQYPKHMNKPNRVGPKMQRVADLLERRGPMALIDVAGIVGPHGSLCYGYQIVGRACAAGLCHTEAPLPGRRGLTLVAGSCDAS
jgi:hypothetical protein